MIRTSVFFICFVLSLHLCGQEIKSGDRIAFLGDSITQQGARNKPLGYVLLVIDGLKRAGIDAEAIPAGISGHKSNQMLERVEKDVIAKKPTWMTLSCGVNDVWHGKRGVALDDYKKNITALVGKVQAAGIKVMLLTPSMITEDPEGENNKKLEPYVQFIRDLAAERKLPLADVSADMHKLIADPALAAIPGKATTDGVHMNGRGNIMMAISVLRAFGIPEAKLREYAAEWKKLPGGIILNVKLSVEEEERLSRKAKELGAANLTVLIEQYLKQLDHGK